MDALEKLGWKTRQVDKIITRYTDEVKIITVMSYSGRTFVKFSNYFYSDIEILALAEIIKEEEKK